VMSMPSFSYCACTELLAVTLCSTSGVTSAFGPSTPGMVSAISAPSLRVVLPVLVLRGDGRPQRRGMAVLTWAGLRGGVSIALALTLPESEYRGRLLIVCYTVVVFSMLLQGLTMPEVIRRLYGRRSART